MSGQWHGGKGDQVRAESERGAFAAGFDGIDWNARERESCNCHSCRPVTMADMRMILCPQCGNKRCPKANHHDHACTGSNDTGQPGSAYP